MQLAINTYARKRKGFGDSGGLLVPVQPGRYDAEVSSKTRMINALTVDVEEYFHPTEVVRDLKEWGSLPCRLNLQIPRILELFERRGVKATFFTLGWVAERFPALVRQIVEAGHEIGCHSYAHNLVYNLTPSAFRADTLRAVSAIQNACGVVPRVYRAPSYSITTKSWWALDIWPNAALPTIRAFTP